MVARRTSLGSVSGDPWQAAARATREATAPAMALDLDLVTGPCERRLMASSSSWAVIGGRVTSDSPYDVSVNSK